MNVLADAGAQTENGAERATGMALSLLTPVTLRDVFIEQQREIRNAEDRVMQLQCTYNEEKVRTQKVREEYNALRSEIEKNNAKLIDVTDATLQLQKQFQDLCKEIEDLNCGKVHLSSQLRLLKEECAKLKACQVSESEEFERALQDQRGALDAVREHNAACDLVRDLETKTRAFLDRWDPALPAAGGEGGRAGEDPLATLIGRLASAAAAASKE